MSQIKKNRIQRWSPSYLRNQGHMSKRQKRIFRQQWPIYGIDLEYGKKIALQSLFSTSSYLVLEIGFGQGEHILHRSKTEPQRDFLGIEVHKPAIANVLRDLQHQNIRIIKSDALVVLADHMPINCLDEVCIFFPEPWDKKNSHRRLLREQTLSYLEPALKNGAHLFFATDIASYASDVLELMESVGSWTNIHDAYAPRHPWRPMSKYEEKGIEAERDIFNLSFVFTKKSVPKQPSLS